jgi:UDP-N-acetylmuramate--alanine ligase
MNIGDTEIKKAYLIGIGGIGMSGLAQLMKDMDVSVSGSDREESPVTELLESKGISVQLSQDGKGVPEDADVVVYSEAVWEDNLDRMRSKELQIPQKSYFDMLGEVSKEKQTIAISGTHGKTTTTGMTAKILRDAGVAPSAIVGSIVKDFGSNYLPGTSDYFVVEACEYKRDFLSLTPSVLVITNIEFDHSDYYMDLADVQSAFTSLIGNMPEDGVVVTDATHPNIAPILSGISQTVVDYMKEDTYELQLPGGFNQANARAAAAVAKIVDPSLPEDTLKTSLESFQGTWRRFEYKGKTKNGADVYDDYAHHPTAIEKTLEEVRKKTKGRLFVAFHPHLYSRTHDLFIDFAQAFHDADMVYIAPIYPAREVDDGRVSSEKLAEAITKNGVEAVGASFADIEIALQDAREGDVIITMGAGDIYKVSNALVA